MERDAFHSGEDDMMVTGRCFEACNGLSSSSSRSSHECNDALTRQWAMGRTCRPSTLLHRSLLPLDRDFDCLPSHECQRMPAPHLAPANRDLETSRPPDSILHAPRSTLQLHCWTGIHQPQMPAYQLCCQALARPNPSFTSSSASICFHCHHRLSAFSPWLPSPSGAADEQVSLPPSPHRYALSRSIVQHHSILASVYFRSLPLLQLHPNARLKPLLASPRLACPSWTTTRREPSILPCWYVTRKVSCRGPITSPIIAARSHGFASRLGQRGRCEC